MRVSVTGDIPETPALSELEQAVLKVALPAGDADWQAQLAQAEVVSRTYSGVGFMTRLRLPPGAPKADAAVRLGAVAGTHQALPGGAEFLVDVRDGRLHSLEAFCYDGMWPSDESGFQLATKVP
ncbi:MAG: hypothetical protein ACR2QB_05930 [Gammaproteobacteria bacterium]